VSGALPHAPHLASVRFDRDLTARLGFRPPQNGVAASFNQVVTVSFRVASIGAEAGCGVGAPGLCSINCLSLAPQTQPEEGMALVLCVDPKFTADADRGAGAVRLFYTFYPAQLPGRI
jgi:hypothetical protein